MMNVLVFCGDQWHPADVPRQGLGALDRAGFTFDWIENAGDGSLPPMSKYQAVILARSNHLSSGDRAAWMTEAVQAALFDYVHSGKGLLAVHSGTAEYDQTPRLRSLLGGVFHHHPEACPVTVQPHADHPLAAGIPPFTIQDEHYFMTMDDEQVDVFMTTRSRHGSQPGGWRRREGDGRVAVLTPGHNLDVWLHASFQGLLLNSLRWCCKLLG